jgi:hypothetical protein
LVYLTAIWYFLWPFGIFLGIWYIFYRFGILYQEQSGNPGHSRFFDILEVGFLQRSTGHVGTWFHCDPEMKCSDYDLRQLSEAQNDPANFHRGPRQGCQMAYFQTKNQNLGNFWRALQWEMLVYVLYGRLVYVLCIRAFGIFFPVLVCCTKKNLATLDPEKSQCYKTTARQ